MGCARIAAVMAGLMLLSGCITAERRVTEDVRVGGHWAAVAMFDDKAHVLTPKERAHIARQDLDLIALSGGGADGAFGAGFMLGWTEAGTRPEFDIVTGVSTGALMSTFVFLGPSYDAALAELYTTTRNDDIFSGRGLEGLLGDSLLDTGPLKAKIASVITDDVIARVAVQHRNGRRLYVATTNLDAGTVTVWNMGAIAASDHPDRFVLYREIVRASSAVPGFFKPVMIHPTTAEGGGAQMHVDGGVKAPILLRSFMLNGPYKRKNIYVLVNGGLRLRTHTATIKPDLAGIAKRSITELLRGLMYKTIYQSYVTVRRAGADFKITYIPDGVPETRDPLFFDPAEMRALFEAGRQLARSGGGWHNEPPRLEPLERIERGGPVAGKPKPHAKSRPVADAGAALH